jgi:hypothetical protein
MLSKYRYKEIRGFGQAKFAHGGLVLGQFLPLSHLPLKMSLNSKVVKIE